MLSHHHEMNKPNKQGNVNKNSGKSKNPLFTCDICKQCFSFKYNLINHLKTHDGGYKTGQESHQCKICDIEYCEYRLLLKHIRNTHFNFEGTVSFYQDKQVNETWIERVNHSNVCVQMTKITDNVIAIQRCSQIKCNVEVTDDKNKQRTVPDDYTIGYTKAACSYCNKKMLRKSIPSHIRERHLNIKPFNCQTCGHNFNRRYQLANHVCGKYRQKPRKY